MRMDRAKFFVHEVRRPPDADDSTVVLLHGSGGDEKSMLDLARKAAPRATLIGVRGRVTQEGVSRWYRRITPTSFDQADIRAEADAFAIFLRELAERQRIDLGRTTFIGYSNGANLVGALTLLHPDLVRRAVLLRAMPVLAEAPAPDLAAARFLSVAGEADETYAPFAPKLTALLRNCGASVDARTIKAGHLLGEEDAEIIGRWLSADASPAATPSR